MECRSGFILVSQGMGGPSRRPFASPLVSVSHSHVKAVECLNEVEAEATRSYQRVPKILVWRSPMTEVVSSTRRLKA